MEKISREHMSDVLTEYYRKIYKIQTNQDNSKIFVIVRDDVELNPIETGYRSFVYIGDVRLTSSLPEGTSEDTVRICVKDYIFDKNFNPERVAHDKELCSYEGKSLEILSPNVSCLPHLYAYEENENIRLILEYLGDNVLGKTYSELSEEDLNVLTEIAVRQPVLQSELSEKNKNYEAIDELVRVGFICRVPVEINKVCTTQRLGVTGRFSERFKLENENLIGKEEYKKQKNEIFKKGLDSIFGFQEAANKHKNKLVKIVPNPEYYERLDRTIRKLEAILKYKCKHEGKNDAWDFYTSGDIAKQLRRELTRNIIFHIDKHVKEKQDIIQGDCYPYNMMIKDGRVIIIDLFHMTFGPWLSDFVEYLTFSNLFCEIENSEVEGLYQKILGERNYRLVSERKTPNHTENEGEFQDLRKRLEMDRTIIFAGSVSNQLLTFGDKFKCYQKKVLEKRRKKYLNNIYRLLDTKSTDGKDLFANSRGLLEQLLFS